jgi:hypothetical protein
MTGAVQMNVVKSEMAMEMIASRVLCLTAATQSNTKQTRFSLVFTGKLAAHYGT